MCVFLCFFLGGGRGEICIFFCKKEMKTKCNRHKLPVHSTRNKITFKVGLKGDHIGAAGGADKKYVVLFGRQELHNMGTHQEVSMGEHLGHLEITAQPMDFEPHATHTEG